LRTEIVNPEKIGILVSSQCYKNPQHLSPTSINTIPTARFAQ